MASHNGDFSASQSGDGRNELAAAAEQPLPNELLINILQRQEQTQMKQTEILEYIV